MAEQHQKLVNKQYNSPIGLYSDRNVREILERETKVLANGAIGIDFNNPLTDKPSNLQNSAVLRMLEEEENRKRTGQPGSLKRVAWPPPQDSELGDFVEQQPVHSQGGPLYSSSKSNQVPSQPQIQQPLSSPVIKQQPPSPKSQLPQQPPQQPQPQPQPQSPIITNNTFQPIISPSPQSGAQSPYQSAPLSPNVGDRSPVSFTTLAKPWSPQTQSAPHFKPVQPPSLRTVQSYQTSEQYHYHQRQSQEQTRETQTVVLPPYQPQETTFQHYQTPAAPVVVETQRAFESSESRQEGKQFFPQKQSYDLNRNDLIEVSQIVTKPSSFTPTVTSIEIQREAPKSQPPTPTQVPQTVFPEPPKPSLLKTVPSQQKVTTPVQSQPSPAAKGIAQNQAPAPQRYQIPAKPVEPPPSTITLRPQAPVSQAPPPLVTSQPATATLRGGKNLRGDLKWPPENVKEKMAAEQQYLIELSKGAACRPRKNCKDYSKFFAKHALTHAYPGYKIPPGTQFYDHNPVM